MLMSGWNQRRNPTFIFTVFIPAALSRTFIFTLQQPILSLLPKLRLRGSHHPHRLIGNYLPHRTSGQKWQFLLTSKLPKWQLLALWQKLPKMAINGCILLPKIAINGMICNSIENLSHFFFLPFLAIFCFFISNNAVQKLPKMAIFINLKVSKNGKLT